MNETNWKSLIDNLLPIYNKNGNDCNKIKTITFGKRIISRNYLNQLFKENGDILETIDNQENIKSKPFLKDEITNQQIIFKFQPQFPSMELTISNFVQLLFKDDDINNDGELSIIPFTEFGIMKSIKKNEKKSYYQILLQQQQQQPQNQISTFNNINNETSTSTTLLNILKNEDKDEKLKKLDSYCFSKLIITTILTNPANGNFENYLFTPMKNGNFKLVSTNNELSFVPESTQTIKTGIFSSEISFTVNTCLFMMQQMHNPIDKEIINRLKSLDVLKFLKEWISSIGKINKQINDLIHCGNYDMGGAPPTKKKSFIHRSNDNKTNPLIKFPEGSIKLLYSKLIRLKEVLIKESISSKKPITLWKLLTILEPFISNRMYLNRQCYPKVSIIENYNCYLKSQDILRNHEPMPLISLKIKISRGINKKNKNQYGLKDLELIDEEISFYNNISSTTMDIDLKNLKSKLSTTITTSTIPLLSSSSISILFEEFLNGKTYYNELSTLSQRSMFYEQVLPLQKDLRYLKFINNDHLTIKLFNSFQFLNGLKRLEISDCKNLKELSNGGSELKLPTLSKLVILNCINLKKVNIYTLALKTFNVRNCENVKEFEVYAPVLEKLKLQSTMITSKLLLKLEGSKYLKYINLSNSTINGVSKSIETSLKNSISLDTWEELIEFKAINLKSLEKISISKELKYLKLLDFNNCSSFIGIINFKRIENGLTPSLEILNFNGTTLGNNEKQLSIFNNLKNK
ncbi:hypothetical protein ACTA71_006346 [Dictyostelium dimigraforme]